MMPSSRTAMLKSFAARLFVICGVLAMSANGRVAFLALASQTPKPPPTDPKPDPPGPKPPDKLPQLPPLLPPCGPTKSCPSAAVALDAGSAASTVLVLEGCFDDRGTAPMLDVEAILGAPTVKYKLQLPSTFDVSAMRGSMVSLAGVLSADVA